MKSIAANNLSSLYRIVMDSSVNPLANLPKIVRFQLMSMLAFMWSGVFSLWIGNIALFGPSALGHLMLLIGVFFTAETFRRAHKHSSLQNK
jgi:hypothetical protein